MAETTAEWKADAAQLDGKILDLPFHQRWALVGSRPSTSTPSPLPPNLLGSGPSGTFSRVASSFKLNSMNRSALILEKPALSIPLAANSDAADAAAFASAMQLAMQAQKSLHRRRIETGSPDRLLKQVLRIPGYATTRVDRGDGVQDVEKGMTALQTKDHKVLHKVKRSRMTKMRLGETIDKRYPSTGTKCPQDMRIRRRQRQQQDTRGQRAALSEFSRWCASTFGQLESAWAFLDQLGKRNVDQQEFVARLQQCKYPTGNLGIKNVFFFLDSDDDDIVHEDEFMSVLRNAASMETRAGTPQAPSNLMDPIEAKIMAEAGSNTAGAQATIIDRVRRHDPVVAELIEYMLSSFLTLKMAFKRIDVNGNGSISKSEFLDTIRSLQSNTGAKPVQVHMQNLFVRLDITNSGFITLDELLHNLQSADPILQRLKQWAHAPVSGHTSVSHESELKTFGLRAELMKTFRVTDGRDRIPCLDFFGGLSRLRYPEWHLNDLWHRLDIDNSGELTIAEFTAFIMKDPPSRHIKAAPIIPLGTEERRKKLNNRSEMALSTKLVPSPAQKITSPLLKAKRDNRLFDTPWESFSHSPTESPQFRLNRPDYLGIVEANVRCGSSELRHRGRHVLTVSSESSPDLCGVTSALSHFDGREGRPRMYE